MLSQRYPLLFCMLVLSVEFSRSKEESVMEKTSLQVESSLAAESEEQDCPVCMWRKHSKEMRLESIKSQILSKLRLKEAPNITREVVNQLLPKAPPLQQILDQHEFQGDSFQHNAFVEEDEYHATTETVISMAQESEYLFPLFHAE
ncbi:PREDICTED: growth/differentiation factor 11-like [Nanorana parkeri]|uniref:growth/differentiation factor 11-like n=1 Tax=Nanorana parkeri TaxID=125878 RepID=UPI000854FC80|nr:PREDICTED: growth/differentiation factor 11-like [Nanorana parkeri]